MVEAYGTCGGEEKCTRGFRGETLKERECLDDLGINGDNIKSNIKHRMGARGME
jgi:hypothetical protein